MYQEEIAALTAEHLQSHIVAYLAELEDRYADGVKLQNPKAIESANMVGGVYTADVKEMPAYAVDIVTKTFSGLTNQGLWEYAYHGHIAGVVTASSEAAVNAIYKRHEQAVEVFVKRHAHMHAMQSQQNNDFRIVELGFEDMGLSGAEEVQTEPTKYIWIGGFRISLVWIVSEDGPGDHA